jgi:integrase
MAKYVHKRPDSSKYQFVLRVPSELVHRYPKAIIRKSLETSDPAVAMKRGEAEFARYQAEFARLRGDQGMTSAEVQTLAVATAKELGTLAASEDYFDGKLQAWAKRQGFEDHSQFEHLPAYQDNTFLDQVDREALRMLQGGEQHGARLSDALKAYFAGHEKASDLQFKARVERDWKTLTESTGDILVRQLARKHANAWRDNELARGLKTDSVKRNSNSIRAVISAAIRELELDGFTNPFDDLRIAGAGKDASTRKTPSALELKGIADKFSQDDSLPALIICMQLGTGTRIAEISGLAHEDVLLDAETPHIRIQPRSWRTLKTEASQRDVPLVGAALEAAKRAVALAKGKDALFPIYAHERGADTASATVNKRLKNWGITSHGFRHGMKDLLREVDCPEPLQREIQGHSLNDPADGYGKGPSLTKKAEWLSKALALVTNAKPKTGLSTAVSRPTAPATEAAA